MLFTYSGLTRRQNKLICEKFNCQRNEFAIHRFEDGYLVIVKNKEYKIKISTWKRLTDCLCQSNGQSTD